jgi:spermidine/putrescine transport system substrate-binding protein
MMMMDNNPDLRFYLPEDQGFNLFIDAMCIPKCAQQKEAAELFIDFMCDPTISGANMDYICYGSPIEGATEYMEDYLAESEVIYPPEEILARGTSYGFLPQDTTRYVENLFLSIRVGKAAEEEEEGGSALPVILTLTGLAAAGVFLCLPKRKKK